MVCESGTIGPETSPCRSRNAISDSKFCAKPHSAEAIVKSSTDSVNSLASPTRRASQPVNGTAIADATEYDEMTQVPWLVATPRLPEMVGTATFAIDVSSTSMNVPSARPTVSSASAPPFNGAGSAAGRAAAEAVASIFFSPQPGKLVTAVLSRSTFGVLTCRITLCPDRYLQAMALLKAPL